MGRGEKEREGKPPALSIKFKNIKLRPNKRKSTKININLQPQKLFSALSLLKNQRKYAIVK